VRDLEQRIYSTKEPVTGETSSLIGENVAQGSFATDPFSASAERRQLCAESD
jgi:hypothetical protein